MRDKGVALAPLMAAAMTIHVEVRRLMHRLGSIVGDVHSPPRQLRAIAAHVLGRLNQERSPL